MKDQQEHCCGPDHDKAFFKAVTKLFKKFPDLANKYAIECVDHETEIMNIDFGKQVAVSKIVGKKVITEFTTIKKAERIPTKVCCRWITDWEGNLHCVRYWHGDAGAD
ncbi:MAG: hypothetical protein ACKVP0_25060 [Pirellulaceae bacterium]